MGNDEFVNFRISRLISHKFVANEDESGILL